MRILVLTCTPREPDNRQLWQGLKRFADVEVRYIDREQHKQLGRVLRGIDFSLYDRVVLDLLFRYLCRQARQLKRISGLLIYEEDACQEFISGSRWQGKFSAFYRKIPNARVIMTGFRVAERFRDMGVDALFLAKGYNSSSLYASDAERDIELGFIGRLGSDTYRERRDFLQRAVERHQLELMRTAPGDEYREALNRIRVFVSADIGLGEYMAKNFEAMACGCVLLAYRQGQGEEQAIGLEDGVNAMLYGNEQEFSEKLALLRNDPALVARVGEQGLLFAQQYLDYFKQSEVVFRHLSQDFPEPEAMSFFDRLMFRLGR
ncbi:glycosyltransferase family protein [Pseudomonas capsici]|uniref:glycosyltransferase family protein n=1 Tax=Pseudomonas capsici TaxID=2810614 RepID=UPI0021F1BFE6|nr:glycosyltransferase [Pseudomonas capsici]MCV4340244.1 glycosyltransferase [Pseudomonas capsici]